MACWSAENATKAYLSTLKMSQRSKEPNVSEFISALAAGNNAQQMVMVCAGVADSTTLLALVAAAHQTGGRVICILPSHQHLNASKNFLGIVEFLIGEAQQLLVSDRFEAVDFVLVDCNLENHEEILKAVRVGRNKENATLVVGYNALNCKGSWWNCGSKTHLLPIGNGLLVTRFGEFGGNMSPKYGCGMGKIRSRWVVKVDKCTGEEHVFWVRMPQGRVIHT